MKKKTIHIVKIGGHIISKQELLEGIVEKISQQKEDCILIHGGGKQLDEQCKKLGIPIQKHNGRRITDLATLNQAISCWAGSLQKKIISTFVKFNKNCIGLTGADMRCIQSIKRPIKNNIDYGYVGDIVRVDITHFQYFLSQKILPVISPLSITSSGQLLNTNADTIATSIALAFAPNHSVYLHYITDVPGVLTDINDHDTVISQINIENYKDVIPYINSGMKPKIESALETLDSAIAGVQISAIDGLFKKQGTWIQ